MSKRNKKHLEFYNRCMLSGNILPYGGLCECAELELIDESLLMLFVPERRSDTIWAAYWAYEFGIHDVNYNNKDHCIGFTPLRQTIVLFMAAINNEL